MSPCVLITGAAARIGRHLAIGLAKDGWTVIIHANRSIGRAEALARSICEAGGKAWAVKANLAVPEALYGLIDQARQQAASPITALINNASTFSADDAQTFSRALFDHHMDVNLYAALKLSQDFAAQCPKAIQGNIINIIDQRIHRPQPDYFTYSLSKAGLYWATQTLAQSLAPAIRVNAVGPGPVLQNSAQSAADFQNECQTTLLGYGSPPETILAAVQYLLSARSVTGQMITVDGGQHLTPNQRS